MELQNCRENNKRMVKAQEEKNQLTTTILQSLTDLQGQVNSRHQRDVKLVQRKKGFKPSHFQDQQKYPSQAMTKPAKMMGDKPRKPFRCWGCGKDHVIKYCRHQNGNEILVQIFRELKWWGNHSNVGNVEETICVGTARIKMGM